MKLDPKKELQVLLAIEDLGEATSKEIAEHLKKDVKKEELSRYLRRLKAKKVITETLVDNDTAYKIASIPNLPSSDMARVKTKLTTLSPTEANKILDSWLKESSDVPKLPTINKYRDYHTFEMTFETIDPILGDRSDESGKCGKFPKGYNGEPFIPPAWWKGWFRSSLYTLNIPETIAKFRMSYMSLGVSNGKGPVKLIQMEAIGEKGPKPYEALPQGTKIKMAVRYPLVGTPIRTAKQFEEFMKQMSENPQRGFGANPFYYGGRMKLVDFIDKGLVSKIVS